MQADQGVVDEALEKFLEQVDVEAADRGAGEGHVHLQAWAAGEVDHHARQRLVQRHVGVAVADDALLVADGLGEGLADGDADILDGMVVVDVQVALALDVQVDQPVAGDLVEHVLEEGYTDVESGLAGAIQIDGNLDLGFQGIALDGRLAFGHCQLHRITGGYERAL
ncbi:hypothetical protein D3C75_658330 [compost metagenome]